MRNFLYILFLFLTACTVDLGDGFLYWNHHIYADDAINPCTRRIPKYVEKYNHDERFIIAKQNPRGIDSGSSDFEFYDKCYDRGLNEYYYWILDKYLCIRYGPYSQQMFITVCNELGVKVCFDEKDVSTENCIISNESDLSEKISDKIFTIGKLSPTDALYRIIDRYHNILYDSLDKEQFIRLCDSLDVQVALPSLKQNYREPIFNTRAIKNEIYQNCDTVIDDVLQDLNIENKSFWGIRDKYGRQSVTNSITYKNGVFTGKNNNDQLPFIPECFKEFPEIKINIFKWKLNDYSALTLYFLKDTDGKERTFYGYIKNYNPKEWCPAWMLKENEMTETQVMKLHGRPISVENIEIIDEYMLENHEDDYYITYYPQQLLRRYQWLLDNDRVLVLYYKEQSSHQPGYPVWGFEGGI